MIFNKPILFISSRHTCYYCNVLKESTLSNTKVVNDLNKNFISVISYSDDGDYLPRELWRPGTPAIWFLTPQGVPMYEPIMGVVQAQDFYNALQIVKDEYKKNYKKKRDDFYRLKR